MSHSLPNKRIFWSHPKMPPLRLIGPDQPRLKTPSLSTSRPSTGRAAAALPALAALAALGKPRKTTAADGDADSERKARKREKKERRRREKAARAQREKDQAVADAQKRALGAVRAAVSQTVKLKKERQNAQKFCYKTNAVLGGRKLKTAYRVKGGGG